MNNDKLLEVFHDTAIKCHIGFKHEGPWDKCEWIECEDRRKLIESFAPAERTEVEGEQWRQGMRDATKEVCDACADEYRYGRARKIEGSTRWWHGEHADFQCEAGSIWHALEADTAAAPADNDAESKGKLDA